MASAGSYYACVGRTIYPVESWEQVSDAYRAACARIGTYAALAPRCQILDAQRRVVAHVSRNGKIWPGERYREGDRPIWSP